MSIATQWLSKDICSAMDTYGTIQEQLEMDFSMWFVPKLYKEDRWDHDRRSQCMHTHAELWCNKPSTYAERPTYPLVEG
jgi:hypothetical protein